MDERTRRASHDGTRAAQAHTNTTLYVHASLDEAFMLLESSHEAGALPFMLLDRRLVGAHASCPTRTWCIERRADSSLELSLEARSGHHLSTRASASCSWDMAAAISSEETEPEV